MKLKKVLAFSISALLFSLSISNYESVFSYAESTSELSDNDTSDLVAKSGLLPEGDNYKNLEFYNGEYSSDNGNSIIRSSYVDLSNDPCFPPLGHQGSSSACVAFATTYYQFSYEVNKLNGVTSTANQVVYSPKWTYNLINNNVDWGSYFSDAYLILSNYGALKYTDLPFDTDYEWAPGNIYHNNYNYSEMPLERIAALETRVSSLQNVTLPNTGTFIYSPNDSDLNAVKDILNAGKVLTIGSTAHYNWKYGYDHNGSLIKMNYRCYDGGAHAMTLVGYDDNAYCDVNNNNIIEDCERGAFKIADSYGINGTYMDTNGYAWILYDALNPISANTVNNWESSLTGTRVQALSCGFNQPTFMYIYVSKYNLNYIGRIDIDTEQNTLFGNQYKIGRAVASGTPTYSTADMLTTSKGVTQYKGSIFFDYNYFCNPINSYLSGYDWYVKFNTPFSSKYDFKVVDNFNNIVSSYGYTNTTATKHVYIGKPFGDVNYSGGLSQTDCDMIQQYLLHLIDLSNLQKVLADANQDGDIDMSDIVHIIQHM